ncbi:TlpA disulfide reductase family protein [Thiomicrorhabdus sp.]|uniref:TlpA family protein disulfide reductase n=1 Tax=Thiomicrorhabdus sp. TaxID=2039724 RepID=UPI0029C8FC8B|nr:TlpA disulfide reductase family protein [Thiomicrorhabdus sp.]
MRIWIFSLILLSWFPGAFAEAAEDFNLSTESNEELTVHVFPATFPDANKPLLVWFTEGYADRSSFKHLITQLNDEGYSLWQVDLLESYFLERTPSNVRRLSGEGIAAVLQHAQENGQPFVPISTGRMSLILLRGARLWQLADRPEKGYGGLQQVVLFFPNLYDAAEKAGDAPQLFPIVSASSLPVTLVQPGEGTYKWKTADLQQALETHHSQVTIAGVPKVRDWYFLRRQAEVNEVETKASNALPAQLGMWLQVSRPEKNREFKPAQELVEAKVTERKKGLVPIPTRSAAAFELTDISGHAINLKEKQGKVVLLNFWASWCPPCVKEIPSMNRLAESFDAKRFEIVSVNFKESPKAVKDFLKQVQVDFPVLIDLDGKVAADYEIFSFPSSFLIDAKGNLRYSVNAAIEWDDAEVKTVINQLLNDK